MCVCVVQVWWQLCDMMCVRTERCIFCPPHIVCSVLSRCGHAVLALLYPFTWQHTFVPVLPATMLDVSCSPTPFLIGVLAPCLPQLLELPIEEVGQNWSISERFVCIFLNLEPVRNNIFTLPFSQKYKNHSFFPSFRTIVFFYVWGIWSKYDLWAEWPCSAFMRMCCD